MEAYERRMTAIRAGEYVPPPDDSYDPNVDLRELQSTHKRRAVERETYMSKEQLQELRRVQNERIEVCAPPVFCIPVVFAPVPYNHMSPWGWNFHMLVSTAFQITRSHCHRLER